MNNTFCKLVFISFTLIGCTPKNSSEGVKNNSTWAQDQPYVVMLSIDGFRDDYTEKYGATNLMEIAEMGVSAESMIPSFPSKTFPNHYTLVTGLRPSNHGIIGNSFYSRNKKKVYQVSDKNEVRDGTWYGGTPLWVLAEQNEMLSASYFWVGSEANIQGVLPTYYEPYNHTTPNDDRIDKVIEWMKLKDDVRPHMITLYFALVDDAGHDFGPEHDETKKAVLEADRLVGRIRKELKTLDQQIYFIVTSDHGMTEINQGIDLSKVDFGDAIMDFSSTMLMVYSQKQDLLLSIREQLEEFSNLSILTKGEAGTELGFINDDRVGDLVILCEPPFVIQEKAESVKGGTHGYDPMKFTDMHTIFYLEGPNISPGMRIKPFDNVEVYPLVAHLLGLEIDDPIDSSQSLTSQILLKP